MSGTIGTPGFWEEGDKYINEERVQEMIGDCTQDIVIRLNSPGGDVFDGIALYNYLKDLPNHITVEVTALAASAASIIAMAGDEVVMLTGSQMMLHEAWTFCAGNKSYLEKVISQLESVDESLIAIYQEKTGHSDDIIRRWLEGETWFTAQEAVREGLADRTREQVTGDDNTLINLAKEEIVNEVVAKLTSKQPEGKTPQGLNKIFGGK